MDEKAADPARFDGVAQRDEHGWHHVSTKPVEAGGRGPKELIGMVDLTVTSTGPSPPPRPVPGRSSKAYTDWLDQRGEAFRNRVQVATLDPLGGYKNAIDDQLKNAVASWTPSTSSSSAPTPSTRSAAASSEPP